MRSFYPSIRLTALLLVTLLSWLFAPTQAQTNSLDNLVSPFGTNLDNVAYWSPEYVFVNALKSAKGWQARKDWATLVPAENDLISTDVNGWVTRLPTSADGVSYKWVSTVMLFGFGDNYPGGQYTILYDGEGVMSYGMDAKTATIRRTPGKDTVTVQPGLSGGGGIELHILETNPNNYIRNIRVLMPGFDETNEQNNLFHPDFLRSLGNFRTIRFMNWHRTNYIVSARSPLMEYSFETLEDEALRLVDGSLLALIDPLELSAWGDRPKLSEAFYTGDKGVPLEVMIALANQANSDPWFNIPHSADDQYVTAFAQLVKESLDPNLDLYLEYSNELWNRDFGQSAYVTQQANATFGNLGNASSRFFNWQAKRTTELCRIFESVFGADSDRINCVIGAQAFDQGAVWVVEQFMDCPLVTQFNCGDTIDSIAIAPYFASRVNTLPADKAILRQWAAQTDGLDKLFQQITQGGLLSVTGSELAHAQGAMQKFAQYAQQWGKELIAYESGQHLTSNEAILGQFFVRANRDPRMADVYQQYYAAWKNAGGKLAVHYFNVGFCHHLLGCWGSAESYNNFSVAPKSQEIKEFIASNPCWWNGCERQSAQLPVLLTMPAHPTFALGPVQVPILLNTAEQAVSRIGFTMSYDRGSVLFNSADNNSDGVPDSLESHLDPTKFRLSTQSGANYISITIIPVKTNPDVLSSGTLLTLHLDIVGGTGAGIWFEEDDEILEGENLNCMTGLGRVVNCTANGQLFNTSSNPTSIQLNQSKTASPTTLLWFAFICLIIITLRLRYRR